MENVVKLKDAKPIASGALNFVYEHPSEPDRLIKILRREKVLARWLRKSRGLPIPREFGVYRTWAREIDEYSALRCRSPNGEAPEFVQRHYGVIDTDLGLGLLVGKVVDHDGQLAPQLARVVAQSGFTEELRRKLHDLQRRIEDLNLVTTDITAGNIVLGWSKDHGDHLVVIEGFGRNTLIPVKSMFPYLNRRSIRRHFARTANQLEAFDKQRSMRMDSAVEPK
jgi:hypothetical protein